MTTICVCGHAQRVHTVLEGTVCRSCSCNGFTPAEDAAAATEAVRAAGERRERLYRQLRTAVARHRFDDARELLDQLGEIRG